MQLPEQPTPAVGQPTAHAQQIINAVEEVYAPQTFYRDTTTLPAVGDTPPVPQPGQPPMSQKATDASVLMLAGGAATVMVSGSAAGLMYFSQFADPVACAIVLGAPVALVIAISRLVSKAKTAIEAAPPTIHQHYNGTVHQDTRTVTSTTRGVIANTRNTTRG
ncbi:hypothetical protein ACIREK_30935 [Streptomyces sp. NPDC102415]|uniref:hypothetical protein n=1 Tax=Streptomyces sp. NPDC102415 TaxID=3366173 RepID=UPI0037F3B43A